MDGLRQVRPTTVPAAHAASWLRDEEAKLDEVVELRCLVGPSWDEGSACGAGQDEGFEI